MGAPAAIFLSWDSPLSNRSVQDDTVEFDAELAAELPA